MDFFLFGEGVSFRPSVRPSVRPYLHPLVISTRVGMQFSVNVLTKAHGTLLQFFTEQTGTRADLCRICLHVPFNVIAGNVLITFTSRTSAELILIW